MLTSIPPVCSVPLTLAADDALWVVLGIISVTWLGLSFVHKVIRTNARERTRREIAAYIAEGSMTPEQGEKLMKSGENINAGH